MPFSRFSSIRRMSSPWLVTPTLKSPSVARMTRLMPPLMNVSARDVVGELDAAGAVRRSARLKIGDRVLDLGLAVAGRRRQHQPAGAGIDDDRDAVFGPERVGEHPHRRLHERQLVGRRHRAGDVEQEDEIARRRSLRVQPASLQPDEREAMARIPGARGNFGRHRERRACRLNPCSEPEVVDQLFDADGVGRRQRALVQEAADVRVRRGVDVDREGRQRDRR